MQKKKASERRRHLQTFLVNDQERKQLRRLADRLGESVSDMLRRLVREEEARHV